MLFENKKIIFFSRNLKIGGMEKALINLLNNLGPDKNQITLILESKSGELLEYLNPNIRVKEYRLSKCKIALIRKTINFLHRLIWSFFNFHRYDFSCNYATYMTVGSKLAAISSKNSSLYVHSDYYNYFSRDEKKVKDFFYMQGVTYLKNIIFVSNEAMNGIKEILPEFSYKFSVIGNLIDFSNIELLSGEDVKEKKSQKELILFVGRLEESSKRLSRLIESFKRVCEKSDDYELWIVGDGADYSFCKELIEKHSLISKVKMLGAKVNPYPYIKIADCVILTSDFEGFPVVYDDCLVLKTPIITTIPVSDEFLDVRKFALITEKDSKNISNAILEAKYKNINFEFSDIDTINKNMLDSLKKIILN